MSVTRCIAPDDPTYPKAMKGLPGSLRRAPLYVRGEIPTGLGVAIVGTRKASPGAVQMATALAEAAATEGFVVWSGGAEGIDCAAHEGALQCGMRTVVVTAGGHDDPFPKMHAPLYQRVLDGGGALISLEPDGAQRHMFQFPRRNYVLVALTLATLVVQAKDKGGTRMSASVARKLNRPLLVVPGAPWTKKGCGGAQELAMGGATAIASVDDFKKTLQLLAARWRAGTQLDLFPNVPRVEQAKRAVAELDPEAASVLAALGSDPIHPDRLCDATGLAYRTVSQSLLSLSLDGIVLEGPSGYFRRAPYISTP